MSRNQQHNPFDDDDNDVGFGNRATKSNYSRDDGDDLKQLQKRIGQVENESLESTQRALRALNEAQETGVKTAQELVRQGEQLNNIDEKLDDIDHTLTSTQKNINNIKSIFGGLKNRFMSSSKSSQKLSREDSKHSLSKSSSNNPILPASASAGQFETITGSDREKEVNTNLDAMSSGLASLNSLALDMKFELERQNPLIEKITTKSENTHGRIDAQDKQMKKIK